MPFQTPQNERSFSSLIDTCLNETGRTGALLSTIGYVNGTVRECQATGLYARDTIEDQITVPATNQDPYIWPRPPLLRQLVTCRYMTQNAYPKFRKPGKGKVDSTLNSVDATQQFVYNSDNYFVFRGVLPNEGIGTWINYWVKPLVYHTRLGDTVVYPGGPYTTRPAYYDITLEKWQYLNVAGTAYVDTTGVAATDLLLQKNAMHWIIDDWWDMIREGTKSKIYKQFDDQRSKLSYAIYMQLRDQFSQNVQIESGPAMNIGADDL